jgi:glutamate synthase (NADPH/NADH) small chain
MEEARAIGKGVQNFSVATLGLDGDDQGRVTTLRYAQAEPAPPFKPVDGTEREQPAELVLLAMGFLHPDPTVIDALDLDKDQRGNIKAATYATSQDGVFAAGDCRRGQSLIVWAINEGRQCARVADRYLAQQAGRKARPAALSGT